MLAPSSDIQNKNIRYTQLHNPYHILPESKGNRSDPLYREPTIRDSQETEMTKRNSDLTVLKQIGAPSGPDVMMIKDKGNRITPAVKYVTEVIEIPKSPWIPKGRRKRRYDAKMDNIIYVTEVITIRDSPRNPSPAPPSPDYNSYSPDYNYRSRSPSPPSSPRDIIKLFPEHQIEKEANAPPSIQMKEPEASLNQLETQPTTLPTRDTHRNTP